MAPTGSFLQAIRPVAGLVLATFLCYTGIMVISPFTPDILLDGLCPGQNECSKVISLVGARQLGFGICTVVIAPVLGGLSDDYGRKPVFLLCLLLNIFAPVLLIYGRSETVIYIWFVLGMLASMAINGGFLPTLLAAVADVVDEDHRSTAVGWAMGSISAALSFGTFSALVIKTANQALWTSVILQASTAIFMTVCLKETNPRRPLLPENESESERAVKLLPKSKVKAQITNLRGTARTVWGSWRLIIIALVDFLVNYALSTLDSFTMYYLKAKFGYGKNEFSYLFLLGGASAAMSQTVIYPQLAQRLGDREVLWVGLLFSSVHYGLNGIAWASWVPYLSAGTEILSGLTRPVLGTMVSKGIEQDHQGKIQGFMGAVRAVAYVLAPLTMTPLALAALGDNPPFGMMGLPYVLCAFSLVVALLLSTRLSPLPLKEPSCKPIDYSLAPSPPQDGY